MTDFDQRPCTRVVVPGQNSRLWRFRRPLFFTCRATINSFASLEFVISYDSSSLNWNSWKAASNGPLGNSALYSENYKKRKRAYSCRTPAGYVGCVISQAPWDDPLVVVLPSSNRVRNYSNCVLYFLKRATNRKKWSRVWHESMNVNALNVSLHQFCWNLILCFVGPAEKASEIIVHNRFPRIL